MLYKYFSTCLAILQYGQKIDRKRVGKTEVAWSGVDCRSDSKLDSHEQLACTLHGSATSSAVTTILLAAYFRSNLVYVTF